MKQLSIFVVAVAGSMFLATGARAGSVTWSAGYPKQGGAGTGVIQVSATYVLDPGYSYSSAVVAYWPVGGGQVTTVPLVNNNGTVSGKFSGTTGTFYNITIQVNEKMGNNIITLASDTKQLQAP